MKQNIFAIDKKFYKMVFAIVFPIMIQNMVNTLVSSVDVIMLGYVDQVSLSASSLANQPYNILSFIFYGVSSGSSILAAQYWGKRDLVTIEKILGIALRLALAFALIFAAAAFFFPELVICIIDSLRNKLVKIRIPYLWTRNRTLFLDFMKYAIPALANDVIASVGWSMYSVILGHLGSDVVVANAIAAAFREIVRRVYDLRCRYDAFSGYIRFDIYKRMRRDNEAYRKKLLAITSCCRNAVYYYTGNNSKMASYDIR